MDGNSKIDRKKECLFNKADKNFVYRFYYQICSMNCPGKLRTLLMIYIYSFQLISGFFLGYYNARKVRYTQDASILFDYLKYMDMIYFNSINASYRKYLFQTLKMIPPVLLLILFRERLGLLSQFDLVWFKKIYGFFSGLLTWMLLSVIAQVSLMDYLCVKKHTEPGSYYSQFGYLDQCFELTFYDKISDIVSVLCLLVLLGFHCLFYQTEQINKFNFMAVNSPYLQLTVLATKLILTPLNMINYSALDDVYFFGYVSLSLVLSFAFFCLICTNLFFVKLESNRALLIGAGIFLAENLAVMTPIVFGHKNHSFTILFLIYSMVISLFSYNCHEHLFSKIVNSKRFRNFYQTKQHVSCLFEMKRNTVNLSSWDLNIQGALVRHRCTAPSKKECKLFLRKAYDPKKRQMIVDGFKYKTIKNFTKFYVRELLCHSLKRHRRDPRYHILYAQVLFKKFRNLQLAIFHLLYAEKLFLNPYSRFMVYRLRRELVDYQREFNSDYYKNKDIEKVLKVEVIFNEAREMMVQINQLLYQFWSWWGRNESFEITKLEQKMKAIYDLKMRCKAEWKKIRSFAKFNKMYQAYYFWFNKDFIQKKIPISEDVLQSLAGPVELPVIRRKTDFKELNFNSFIYSNEFAVLHVSISKGQLGTIMGANSGVEMLFGYPPEFIVGKNINLLIPEPIATYHDEILTTYFRDSRRYTIGSQYSSYGRTCRGDLIHVSIFLKMITNFFGDYEVVGLITDIKTKDGIEMEIVCDLYGNAYAATPLLKQKLPIFQYLEKSMKEPTGSKVLTLNLNTLNHNRAHLPTQNEPQSPQNQHPRTSKESRLGIDTPSLNLGSTVRSRFAKKKRKLSRRVLNNLLIFCPQLIEEFGYSDYAYRLGPFFFKRFYKSLDIQKRSKKGLKGGSASKSDREAQGASSKRFLIYAFKIPAVEEEMLKILDQFTKKVRDLVQYHLDEMDNNEDSFSSFSGSEDTESSSEDRESLKDSKKADNNDDYSILMSTARSVILPSFIQNKRNNGSEIFMEAARMSKHLQGSKYDFQRPKKLIKDISTTKKRTAKGEDRRRGRLLNQLHLNTAKLRKQAKIAEAERNSEEKIKTEIRKRNERYSGYLAPRPRLIELKNGWYDLTFRKFRDLVMESHLQLAKLPSKRVFKAKLIVENARVTELCNYKVVRFRTIVEAGENESVSLSSNILTKPSEPNSKITNVLEKFGSVKSSEKRPSIQNLMLINLNKDDSKSGGRRSIHSHLAVENSRLEEPKKDEKLDRGEKEVTAAPTRGRDVDNHNLYHDTLVYQEKLKKNRQGVVRFLKDAISPFNKQDVFKPLKKMRKIEQIKWILYLFFIVNTLVNVVEFVLFDYFFRSLIFSNYDSQLSCVKYLERNLVSYNQLVDSYLIDNDYYKFLNTKQGDSIIHQNSLIINSSLSQMHKMIQKDSLRKAFYEKESKYIPIFIKKYYHETNKSKPHPRLGHIEQREIFPVSYNDYYFSFLDISNKILYSFSTVIRDHPYKPLIKNRTEVEFIKHNLVPRITTFFGQRIDNLMVENAGLLEKALRYSSWLLVFKISIFVFSFSYTLYRITGVLSGNLVIMKALTFVNDDTLQLIILRLVSISQFFKENNNDEEKKPKGEKSLHHTEQQIDLIHYLKEKNANKKFERRRRLDSKSFLKAKKIRIIIYFIFSTILSMILTYLIKQFNFDLNEILSNDMAACHRIHEDMVVLPSLSIAMKERLLNKTFYDRKLKNLTSGAYLKLEKKPEVRTHLNLLSFVTKETSLERKIMGLYFTDICDALVTKLATCYELSSRSLENGLGGFKEHLRNLLQVLAFDDKAVHRLTRREMFDIDRTLFVITPLLDSENDNCGTTIEAKIVSYQLYSFIVINIFCVTNFCLVLILKTKVLHVLSQSYKVYRGLFKHFIPMETIRRDNNIRFQLIRAGVLADK